MSTKTRYTVTNNERGWRLDKVVTFAQPSISLRTCRRLIKGGFITIENLAVQPSKKVRDGQTISIEIPKEELGAINTCAILNVQNSLIAIYKPSGIHTMHIEGGPGISLEKIFQKTARNNSLLQSLIREEEYSPQFLNRLDQETSGIIVVSLKKLGETLWKSSEQTGAMRKSYLTIVEGKLLQPITIANFLYVQNRAKTKVSSHARIDDIKRHTLVKPLKIYKKTELQELFPGSDNEYVTLVQCVIKKGMRHQIRAHLSAKGFPIAGDRLYGSTTQSSFFLHHYKTTLPGFKVSRLPEWLKTLNKSAGYSPKNANLCYARPTRKALQKEH